MLFQNSYAFIEQIEDEAASSTFLANTVIKVNPAPDTQPPPKPNTI